MADCVVVGSVIVDLVTYMTRFPNPGETLQGSEFKMGYGGKGANQAFMASQLGCSVHIVGKVGSDSFGKDYISYLNSIGISTSHVTETSKASTGVASILVTQGGQNSIVVVPGANFQLTNADVDNATDLIKSARVVVCQLEIPTEVTRHTLELARSSGAVTILNPAPIPTSFYLDADWFTQADVICPNEQEAALLFPDIWVDNAGGDGDDVVEKARRTVAAMAQRGCKMPMVTMGDKGIMLLMTDGSSKHVPAPRVEAIDTTGAGDSFVGSLAYYFARHPELSLDEKVKRAVQIASISVQSKGTQSSFPSRQVLNPELFQ